MSEVTLLPLPDWMQCLGQVSAEHIRDYARANMEPLIAENERLAGAVREVISHVSISDDGAGPDSGWIIYRLKSALDETHNKEEKDG